MSLIGKVKHRMLERKDGWEDAMAENIGVLHDGADALEARVDMLTAAYDLLAKEFSTLANSYRELKLKVK
jgi:hypothetical protein